jgi:hypothetical protein
VRPSFLLCSCSLNSVAQSVTSDSLNVSHWHLNGQVSDLEQRGAAGMQASAVQHESEPSAFLVRYFDVWRNYLCCIFLFVL